LSTEKRGEPAQPAQPAQGLEQLVAELVKSNEENRRNIELMAKAIVEVNKKVEGKAQGGNPSQGTDALTFLASLVNPKGGSMEDFAKQAKSFAEIADALERYRHPSRLGVGEALLMRLGMRSAFPRYMTKAEIQRAEKMLGGWEVLEEAEGEHPE